VRFHSRYLPENLDIAAGESTYLARGVGADEFEPNAADPPAQPRKDITHEVDCRIHVRRMSEIADEEKAIGVFFGCGRPQRQVDSERRHAETAVELRRQSSYRIRILRREDLEQVATTPRSSLIAGPASPIGFSKHCAGPVARSAQPQVDRPWLPHLVLR
jgi:hypothetical protein